ncbi:class I SAM-dependent methyltransferase [Algisphaera agarilytica]|uniref:Ribosomal RNA small subunit methyltransferase J n=1 Tax=Algisphaera agarilytica TaxID=1385975 RepID=A0A7X0H9G0_9BACT|nr:class I SAM-dependent methyltransferase [Algisphaera agarilytica]MBB6430581.1 16S rRNA (guanine1516-N2)-methyltransferase [Algisphaera agarilytica]
MPHTPPSIAVSYDQPHQQAWAEAVAAQLGLPIARKFNDPHPMHLAVAEVPVGQAERLELRVVEAGHPLAGGHGVFADLPQLDTTSPAGRSLKTPLLKAVGINKRSGATRPRVLDATAGLGEDTWLLAAAGCTVTAVERHPIVHALLADALQRARLTEPDITDRITLADRTDATDALREAAETSRFDVVLIDPMFPGSPRRKTTERKPMRVLRWLVGEDADADGLLESAMKAASRRVVVKRPKHAPHLAGVEPVAVHSGKGLRFEVIPTS